MAGVLVGVPSAFTHDDFTTITLGYVVMRIAMVAQWWRPKSIHQGVRRRRYALGVALVQVGVGGPMWLW